MWQKLKKRIWKWRSLLITAPTVAGLAIAANAAGWFELLEWATLDEFFRLRPLEAPDRRIVIVTLDESDINHVGKWPIPDLELAKLLTNLKAQQPRVIGLDLYRDLAVEPGHDALVEIFKSTPNLIGVEKVVRDSVAPPPTLKERDRVAIADLVLDADGKVRRGLLSVKPKNEPTKLSLAVRLSLHYLEAEGISLEMVDPTQQHLRLGQALFVPFQKNDGGYIRADAGGYQILLNYRGSQDRFATISMTDVLENRIPANLMRDRIVLIGATGQSLNDLFLTPYSSSANSTPHRTPGVVIHANLVSQIVSGALSGRPFIRVWSEPVEWLWIFAWSIAGSTVSYALVQAHPFGKNGSPRWIVQSLCIVLTASILLTSSALAFANSLWIPVVSPFLALTGSAIAIAVYHSRGLQRQSEKTLAQFLEALPVAIGVLDANGRPCYTNPAAQELLGQGVVRSAQSEQIAEVYQIYIAGTQQLYPSHQLPLVRALNGERAMANDMEIRQGDRTIPIEALGTPIYDESGNIAYAIVAFQDITERKQAEAERERFTKELFELNRHLGKALDAELELTDAYGRFVPHQFLYFLGYESIVDVQLGEAVELEMSILFSDIRDFTTLSEGMTPQENFKFINSYLSRMEPAIAEHNGFIDKYIGDAIMALFAGSADDAVKAGIAMQRQLVEYNETRQKSGDVPIHIGIGINTGSLMLGTVGGQNRMDSTVISDSVNLASRLEGLTKNYGVSLLISHQTFSKLEKAHEHSIRPIDRVKVKGKSEIVSIFEVFDADPPEVREGKLLTKTKFEQALLHYNMNFFIEAAQLFHECLQINPGDNVARTYLERSRHQANRSLSS